MAPWVAFNQLHVGHKHGSFLTLLFSFCVPVCHRHHQQVKEPGMAPEGKHCLHAYLPATEPYHIWNGVKKGR